MEFIGSLAAGLYGLLLLNPWVDTFASNPRVFGSMAVIFPEAVWGALFLLAGTTSWLGLRLDSLRLRQIGMLSICALRLFALAEVAQASQGTASGLTDYLCWSILCLWAYWRISDHDQS